jgi:hypothetical protein
MTYPDTRTIAKEWFEEHIPDGSKVLIEGLTIEPTRLTIPLHNSAQNLREVLEHYRVIKDRGKVKYLEFKLQVMPERTYDLELVMHRDLRSFADYKEAGIEYLVVRPEAVKNARTSFTGVAFLDDLRGDPDVSLMKSFRFDPRSRTGPDIDIYRIDSNVDRVDTSSIGRREFALACPCPVTFGSSAVFQIDTGPSVATTDVPSNR